VSATDSEIDLEELRRRVARARTEMEAPPKPDEVKAILPLTEYLAEEDWHRVWAAVRAIRRKHPELFARFPETTLAGLIVDELATTAQPITLTQLAARLEALADSEGPWLVSTPLANIALPEPAIKLADDAVLWRAELGREWMEERFTGSDDNSEFDVHRMLGDRISRPARWVKFSNGSRIDTRRGATLLTVEDGVIGLALPRARARAQYAIAVWSVLRPPEDREVLPELGIWVPQPHLQWRQRYKLREQDAWIAREQTHGGGIYHWAEYPAPRPDLLRVPFEAMDALDKRCAQALLSASLALLQASRASRSPLSEQLRNLHSAIEALCEPAPGAPGASGRWRQLADRLGVWSELAKRGYEEADVDAFQKRLNVARNVATHGSDAALLDLGYPADAHRILPGGRQAKGEDLAFSAVNADLTPLRFAVRFAIRELICRVRAKDWDDSAFEQEFA
jgi:hypothetical protein